MRFGTLLRRSLGYYWRTNLAVTGGVATAVAVLSGALLVGDSVRGSLQDLVLRRLGSVDYVVSADHFFRAGIAASIAASPALDAVRPAVCPIVHLQGIVIHEASGRRARQVEVYGVDESFWQFHGLERKGPHNREALAGEVLARELGAEPGDALLLRVETQDAIPGESFYGRRDQAGRTTRLTCAGIVGATQLGEFSLRPGQAEVPVLFVDLARVQRDLALGDSVNSILVSAGGDEKATSALRAALRSTLQPPDAQLVLQPLEAENAVSALSDRIILPELPSALLAAAAEAQGMQASWIYTYLATSIKYGEREIPYSVITAADIGRGALGEVRLLEGTASEGGPDVADSIWLNEWARNELEPPPGAGIEVSYFVWRDEGRLETATTKFRFAGVVAIGGDVGPALAPDFPGITETRSVGDWDPPFPMDMRRIRPADERYWDDHRATPKAFITLERGRRLWGTRFGSLTSIRIRPRAGTSAAAAREALVSELRERMEPEDAGFLVTAVRSRGLAAARGATDFGEYFVYFSFFLIVSAVLLSALFFRLGVEQRVRELGTLRAEGFPAAWVRNLFLAEGGAISLLGSLLGLPAAVGYAALLMLGLRTWWVEAVGTRQLSLHISWISLPAGALIGTAAALVSIAATLRGLKRSPPRALISGILETEASRRRLARAARAAAFVSLGLALGLLAASLTGSLSQTAGFFGAGSMLLVAAVTATGLFFRRERRPAIVPRGRLSFLRLGSRNATHRPGRSVWAVALIAAATFIVVAVEAFRHSPEGISLDPHSGTGGFPLLAESAIPIVDDLNSADGRYALGLNPDSLTGVRFYPFRAKPGDDTSCLNLYAPQEPRVLAAPPALVRSGRFSFAESLDAGGRERENPWLLLERPLGDGAVPAVGDANTIQYVLHRQLGEDIVVRGSGGRPVTLRLVASLKDSVLQGELLISEADFLRHFPGQEGFRFFLIDAPPEKAPELTPLLETELEQWGFDVQPTAERLAAFHSVENTYLSTFQSLGGLGLVLGTAGLGAILLRNVLERRRELALLRAVGFRRATLAAIVVVENALLMALGLACGAVSALVAVGPALAARAGTLPLAGLSLLLGLVFVSGLAASLLAVAAAFRSPLLSALRSE